MSGDAIGMLGPGGGWGIPIAPPTLMITVGGIATKPRYLNGQLDRRELLDLTISVDQDIVDGAPGRSLRSPTRGAGGGCGGT
jgi:pyruvate/2-oxoglutarate dehydrogenase complex dihydrolipoamide acyltransferase (E2) component